MMTGKEIDVDLCHCGCFHIDPNPPGCQCQCPVKDVRLDNVLLGSKYSDSLCDVVIGLIRLNRENSARALISFERAWPLYMAWRRTAEGQAHFDHYDDLMASEDGREEPQIGGEEARTGD
jgi:hypothetical protein